MPAYNAAKTLRACYEALPKDLVDEVIFVDDASQDETVAVARSLPLFVEVHPENRGYGGNQKTCYKLALKHGADIIIMIHPDHQYDPGSIPELLRVMRESGAMAVFGSRMMVPRQALRGGMPGWKYCFNIILTKFGNWVLGTKLTEFHSGLRAYDARIFSAIDISRNSDDFVFDTQIIIQLVEQKTVIREIPIPTRYFPEASQIGFWPSVRYGCEFVWNLIMYRLGLHKF